MFWVPQEARWSNLQSSAKQSTIGKIVDDAMVALERDNPRLKGVLPKDYARPGLDKHRLGELIDLIATIELVQPSPDASRHPLPPGEGRGEGRRKAVDLLGRVYEYFLTRFASAEGNANFAWVQHFIHHLAPHGMAGFVLANGSMSSNQSGEGDIRRALGFASYAN